MCRELDALNQSIDAYAKGFDPRALTQAQAGTVVHLCSRIEARIESIRTLAAARQAEGVSHKAEGYRSADERLARTTGMSPSRAKRLLRTGQRMLQQPRIEQAALAGDLSPEQAEAVAAGAEANPDKTEDLVRLAKDSSLAELHEEVARIKAQADDLETRRRRIHSQRRLTMYTDLEGVFRAHLAGNPQDGITLDQVLTEIRRKLTTNRRELQIPNETMATMDYDALIALLNIAQGRDGGDITLADLLDIGLFPQLDVTDLPAAGRARSAPPSAAAGPPSAPSGAEPGPSTIQPLFAGDGGPPDPGGGTSPPPTKASRKWLAGRPVKIIVRIDFDTLLRGYPLDGETCDVPGYGPIPVSLVHDLIRSDQAKLACVLTKHRGVAGVYLDRRHPNAYQETALDWLYPTCAAKGCNVRRGMQADHRDDWSRTHYTALDLLDYLCYFHHGKKTKEGWGLVSGMGKRDFVPPTDPRHPRHHRPPAGPARPPVAARAATGAGAGPPDDS